MTSEKVDFESAEASKGVRPQRVALLILGMHRSGTSALTRVLNLLGVELGGDLIPANRNNQKGYWEHNGIFRIHDSILHAMDREWSDISPLPDDWVSRPGVPELFDQLARLVRSEFEAVPLWGVKDPRLCELLSGWEPILREMRVDARCVLTIRHPLEVARSLAQRDAIPQPKALSLWLRHVVDAEYQSRAYRRCFVSYDALLADWSAVVRRIEAELGIEWFRTTEDVRTEVEEFLDPGLRHHAVGSAEQGLAPLLQEALNALSASGWTDSPSLRTAFDRIRTELNERVVVSPDAVREIEQENRRRIQGLRAELVEHDRRSAEEVSAIRNGVGELEAQREALTAALHRAESKLQAQEDLQARLEQETRHRLHAEERGTRLAETTAQLEEQRDQLISALGAAEARANGAEARANGAEARANGAEGFARGLQAKLEQETRLRTQAEASASLLSRSADENVRLLTTLTRRLTEVVAEQQEKRRNEQRVQANLDSPAETEASLTERAAIFFDEAYYLRRYPKVAASHLAPYEFYLAKGWSRGQWPSAGFDPGYYQRTDPSSVDACPITHYLSDGARNGASPHPLFDPVHYLSQVAADDESASAAPYEHYLTRGWQAGLSPHPLFDPEYYARQAPDSIGRCPLLHYLEAGADAVATPHPLFDPAYYRSQLSGDGLGDRTPLDHYVRIGWRRKLRPHPLFDPKESASRAPAETSQPRDPLSQYLSTPELWDKRVHLLFQPAYYVSVARADNRAPSGPLLLDYVTRGARRAYSPHPLFSIPHYLSECPDAQSSPLDPLSHYLCIGDGERRNPHAYFDVQFYYDAYGDVIPEGSSALEHFVSNALKGMYDPCEWFDTRYYLATNVGSTNVNPLRHFLTQGLERNLSPSWTFSPRDYETLNPDVSASGISSVRHWIDHRSGGGRPTISGHRLQARISQLPPIVDDAEIRRFSADEIEALRTALVGRRVAVLTNSLSNFFMNEIAAGVASALATVVGSVVCVDCAVSTEQPLPEADVYIVPAPHETLTLGDGPDFVRKLDWSRVVSYNTEQAQSQWFNRARPYLKRSRLALDMNWQTAVLLAENQGRPTAFLPAISPYDGTQLIDFPEIALWEGLNRATRTYAPSPKHSFLERPLDVSFAGSRTPRRIDFFAKSNKTFAQYECFLYLKVAHRQTMHDENEGRREGDLSRFFTAISQRSKILLNIHRDDFPYFEWHRIVCQGIAQGAVVITEPSFPAPSFESGKHFIAENLRWIPDMAEWLLREDDGRQFAERIRRAGVERYESLFGLPQHGARIATLISDFLPADA